MKVSANGKVTIQDSFWSPIRDIVRRQALPYQWLALNDKVEGAAPSYCMRNFRVAAGREQGGHAGCVFQDSDAAKWLEGVAYTLMWQPDAELEAIADSAIDDIVAAQQPDGYLDTYYIINGLDKRWTNLRDNHELYCAGHMIEAAVAYCRATGKRKLLDAMLRYVEHIDSMFGPEEGKLKGYPGHPVIEMALMELYAFTGEERCKRLAKYFVDQRGQSPLYFEEEGHKNGSRCYWDGSALGLSYYQAHKPVREQADAEGHAVRALYLYAGMADVARETGDAELQQACDKLWRSVADRRMYITGAVGSSEYGEAFTLDYDLPNDTVYGETCASIALVFFARRMLLMRPRGEYADVIERALYNGILSGMQLDGRSFFYVNPLEVLPEACEKDQRKRHVKPQRQPWFGCACCPPNLIRLASSLERYVYAEHDGAAYVNLYIGSEASFRAGDGQITFDMRTDYPWSGDIMITAHTDGETALDLALRIPVWCQSYTVRVNGEALELKPVDGYAHISRAWREGDEVRLALSMPVALIRANPRVAEDAGNVAVTRGPIVYCLEECDNGGDLHLVTLDGVTSGDFTGEYAPDLLGGVYTLKCPAKRETTDGWDDGALYSSAREPSYEPTELKWIPYYAWANRGIGEMRVWVRK